ncbi:MAG: lipopolysaccharide/colanic/teichoic acid biosynthesis glycosyltransferase [Salibacteraceae bacterium]|jgi:lipopolysaccharide/colanic/teichoic acid biosynthesis glycosyltransferase
MLKRTFDVLSSLVVLLLVSPFFVLVSTLIIFDSKGGVFYKQKRVGENQVLFCLYKFRTMRPDSDQVKITVGDRDPRVTSVGYYLRKFKLDELPQLINILKGEMSVVGPRPEVKQYVDLYSKEQLQVLTVKPGLSDLATLEYVKESELLSKSCHPEKTYVEEIMPDKLRLNLKYIELQSFALDLEIIFKTFAKIIG